MNGRLICEIISIHIWTLFCLGVWVFEAFFDGAEWTWCRWNRLYASRWKSKESFIRCYRISAWGCLIMGIAVYSQWLVHFIRLLRKG